MVFNTRNLYYLRIADKTVIPLYVGARWATFTTLLTPMTDVS